MFLELYPGPVLHISRLRSPRGITYGIPAASQAVVSWYPLVSQQNLNNLVPFFEYLVFVKVLAMMCSGTGTPRKPLSVAQSYYIGHGGA